MTRFVFTCNGAHFDLTLFEFRRADASFSFLRRLSEDVGLAQTALSPDGLAETVRAAPVIFVRHLFAVEEVLPARAEPELLCAAALPLLDASGSVSVQTRFADGVPADPALTAGLSARLAERGFAVDVAGSRQIVSVYRTEEETFLGVGNAAQNLTHRSGGEPHYAREGFGFVSRAEFKLREALEAFGLSLDGVRTAVDLGAAPGGWTKVLAERGIAVTAVDPSRLRPEIAGMENVRYVQMRAEDFLKLPGETRFDLAVNDMKLDVAQSVRVMNAFWPRLSENAAAVMTFKLPHGFSYRDIAAGMRSLRGYGVLGARQLFHNRSEITVVLRRTAEQPAVQKHRGQKTPDGLSRKLARKYGKQG